MEPDGIDRLWYFRIGTLVIITAIYNILIPNLIDLARYLYRLCVQFKDRDYRFSLRKIVNDPDQEDDVVEEDEVNT